MTERFSYYVPQLKSIDKTSIDCLLQPEKDNIKRQQRKK